MDVFLKNSLVRGIALIPVGIGSVMGTIYMTNLNKPLNSLDSLTFGDRPEIEENKIIPLIPETGSGGTGGAGGGDGAGSGTGGDNNGEGTESSETPSSDNSEEQTQNQESETQDSASSEEEDTKEVAGTDPEVIIRQVVKNITELDLTRITKIETLAWLLNHFAQGKAALKLLQSKKTQEAQTKGEATEGTSNGSTEPSSSTGSEASVSNTSESPRAS